LNSEDAPLTSYCDRYFLQGGGGKYTGEICIGETSKITVRSPFQILVIKKVRASPNAASGDLIYVSIDFCKNHNEVLQKTFFGSMQYSNKL
jgi:hypothetical protein